MPHDLLRVLTCGSVDDGKSTLIGRLLTDAGGLYDDQRERDLARVTDGLKAEREQGITIDVAYRYFATSRRAFIVADTPGHEQYTRNMVSGASTCELAVLLVDVRHGLRPQTRRHAAIAALLGIRHLVLAVNKMDLVDFDPDAYESICDDFRTFTARLTSVDVQCVPIAALGGDNVVRRSAAMPWYEGSTLLYLLETVQVATGRNAVDLRLPIQSVCAPEADGATCGYRGSLRSGTLRVGDDVVVLPSGSPARVAAMTGVSGAIVTAETPDAVTVELDAEVAVTRGDMIVHARNQPRIGRRLDAMLVWMGDDPFRPGERYLLKHLATTTGATAVAVDYRMRVEDLRRTPADRLAINEFGRCRLECDTAIAWDPFERNRATGAFIVIDRVTMDTVGAGMIIDRLPEAPAGLAARRDSASRAGTIWLTGLSGAGKSAIAERVARHLSETGVLSVTLDGDVMRAGLCSDLSFSPEDRSENARRLAEVARLFTEAGFVVLVPVISPYAADRARARALVGPGRFHEVWVDAPVEVCEARDVKGLYRKARAGDVRDMTGVSSPYEAPAHPDLVLKTAEWTIEHCASLVLTLVTRP